LGDDSFSRIDGLLKIQKKEWLSKLKTKDRLVHLKSDDPYNSTAPDFVPVEPYPVFGQILRQKLAISMQ